jgi:hypothetical protein
MKHSKQRKSHKKRCSKKKTNKQRTNKQRTNTKKLRLKGGELDPQIKDVVNQNILNKNENFSKMLQVSCKNPGNCLALGKYNESIKLFFDDFQNLNYVDNNHMKRIGNPSANGFIIEVPFKKLNYTAYTALKCSSKAESDNLLYEFFVGKMFINRYLKKLPSFVETYELYEFNSDHEYNNYLNAATTKNFANLILNNSITPIDRRTSFQSLISTSCIKNKLMCILIQHFDKFNSFNQEWKQNYDNIKYDLYNILYQVYFSLAVLGDKYTHYDLHDSNVFLYKPFENNQCLLMRYHTANNQIIEFKSEYIVKIIDYGRNYFNNSLVNSNTLLSLVCNTKECDPDCGLNYGYGSLITSDPSTFFYWIDPTNKNMSHDLRFANIIKTQFSILTSLVYKNDYGTPEDMTGDKANIKSIFDLVNYLEDMLPKFNAIKQDKKYDTSWKVVATMDIYHDGRDYEFNVLPDTSVSTPTSPSSTPISSVSTTTLSVSRPASYVSPPTS